MKVLIIIPAYNEQENLERVVADIRENAPWADYLIVDDCSRDATRKICEKNKYQFVSLPINLGIGGGVQTGYRYALENDYDIAVQLDGDGQHDPKYIQRLISPIIEKKSNIVIGSRFITQEGFQSSAARRMGIRFLSSLIRLCAGVRIKDVTSGFRAVDREYIRYYAEEYPQDYPEPEAIVAARLRGAVIKEVPVFMRERENGVSSINLPRSAYYMVKVSLALVICRFSRGKRTHKAAERNGDSNV